ncbi:MAG: GAF domain-containing protein [Armatimonadota bacterium]|nr:GAF domain-containing protein [Armatimonadota bacterium]
MDEPQQSLEEALAQAQETIARLERRLADERFAEDLRSALSLATTAGTIASPVTHSQLLEMIVETAAHVIHANSASLLLVDDETQELVFEVALGQKADSVKKFRVPLGHGIAGLVAASGQPMAISRAGEDSRQAADIAQRIGYRPETLLCVPLFYNDRVIGVLELLDKENGQTFTPEDMEALGLFAGQAAVAIEQSATHQNLTALMLETLEEVAPALGGQGPGLGAGARAFAQSTEADPAYRRTLELARLVHEIAQRGDAEARACRAMLQGFADYLRGGQSA